MMGLRRRAAVVAMIGLVGLAAANGASAQGTAPTCAVGGAHPWCDATLDPDVRAELLLAEMTVAERIGMLAGDEYTGAVADGVPTGTLDGIPRLDVPTILFTDGPIGVRDGLSTQFPASIALASSWDVDLAHEYGRVIADEAFHKGRHVLLGPTVNIARNALGGRTFEGFGEDPHLTSRLGVAWIQGAQSEPVIASVKHYAVNNQETDRFVTNADVDDRTLREIYLPAFEAAVLEAGTGTVMASYNRVDGVKVTQNHRLLTEILRDDWGFEGIALTDWYLAMASTAPALVAGTDLEMPYRFWFDEARIQSALASGQISQGDIDRAVLRTLRTWFAFGIFDRPPIVADGDFDAEAHALVARDAGIAGTILLRNEGGFLPLDLPAGSTLALIGAPAGEVPNGGGSSAVAPTSPITPREGIEARAAAAGVTVVFDDGADRQRAAQVAAAADAAVVVVANASAEFSDRPCLMIDCAQQTPDPANPGLDAGARVGQDELVAEVVTAQPSTAVVLYTGGPVLMPWRDDAAAILQAWYGGMRTGEALAAILFGDVEPSGRTPITFPADELQAPTAGDPSRYPGIGLNAVYSEGVFVGYRHWDAEGIEPLFPFGHGLGYTTFDLGAPTIISVADGLVVEVALTNTGDRAGSEVVQLYLGRPDVDVAEPPRWLVAFDKVRLEPGVSTTVRLQVPTRAMAHWDVSDDLWRVSDGCHQLWAGRSSRDLSKPADLRVIGGLPSAMACDGSQATPVGPVDQAQPADAPPVGAPLPATGGGAGIAGLALAVAVGRVTSRGGRWP